MARTEREPETGLKGILSTVGGTPLVELERLMPGFTSRVFAKVERFNPGGSVKDRSALNMVATKIRSGELVPGRSTVIESSSGNLAIGLAQICGYYGLRLVCVVDTRTTRQNIAILRAYGAEVEIISEPDPATGELLSARLHRVAELVATTPDAHWPDQYANPLNRRAHETTMGEIAEALDGKVDQLVVAHRHQRHARRLRRVHPPTRPRHHRQRGRRPRQRAVRLTRRLRPPGARPRCVRRAEAAATGRRRPGGARRRPGLRGGLPHPGAPRGDPGRMARRARSSRP